VSDLHVLSSYDEFIHFLGRMTNLPSSQFSNNIIVVLNCEALAKFLQSSSAPQISCEKLLSIPPYPRKGGIIGHLNVIAERRYFQRAWKNLLSSIEISRLDNLCVYTNFMNGPTASLINYIRSVKNSKVCVKLYPSLNHINISPHIRPSLRQYISLFRNRIVHGPYLRLVDIGHKIILSIPTNTFDKVEIEKRSTQYISKGIIKHKNLTNKYRKVVFACQPLLKNNRVTVEEYRAFFDKLCKILSKLDIKIVFKLHPGEIASDYEYLGASIVSDEIPFQLLDISSVDAILTFSSGSVVGLSKPIISCTELLQYRSLEDKNVINKLFDVSLANTGQASARRPKTWEDFINDIKKNIDSRT
jgi:hypothetical protein